jgi:hypothetical protein
MKTKHAFKAFVFFIILFFNFIIPARPALAAPRSDLPAFPDFVAGVTNGQAGVIRGVYVPGVLAYRVVQQPAENPFYVSPIQNVVTQFSMAAQNNVIGLLAHNHLAGAVFSNLSMGQEIRIVYGDGKVTYYVVNQIARFQAMQPDSSYSNFIDLNSNITYTAQDVFRMFYQNSGQVVFQTCILSNGQPSWGRLFVSAVPAVLTYLPETRTVEIQAR